VKLCEDVAAKLPAEIPAKIEEIRKEVVDGKIAITKAK
jgi:basic membrane protein A